MEKVPFLALAAAASYKTADAQHVGVWKEGVLAPLSQRLENVVVSYVRYLENLVWPVNLSLLYPNYGVIGKPMWVTWQWGTAALIVLVITLLALWSMRRRPYFTVGWLWYLGTLIPVIGLVQVGRQAIADRYTYIPFIGLYIALAWAIDDAIRACSPSLPGRGKQFARLLVMSALVFAVLALAHLAHRQVWLWRDSRTIFQHALEVTKDNWVMHVNVAWQLANHGDVTGGKAHFEEALRICPECNWERTNYGIMLANAGEWYEAEQQYRRVIEIDPKFVPAYTGLGQALIARGQKQAGMEYLRMAVEVDPTMAESRMLLASYLINDGLRGEAAQQIEEAIRLKPEMKPFWQPTLDDLRK